MLVPQSNWNQNEQKSYGGEPLDTTFFWHVCQTVHRVWCFFLMTFLSVTLWASWFSTKLRFQISNRIKTEGVVLVVLLGCFTISSCVGFLKSVAYSALHIATRTATYPPPQPHHPFFRLSWDIQPQPPYDLSQPPYEYFFFAIVPYGWYHKK